MNNILLYRNIAFLASTDTSTSERTPGETPVYISNELLSQLLGELMTYERRGWRFPTENKGSHSLTGLIHTILERFTEEVRHANDTFEKLKED